MSNIRVAVRVRPLNKKEKDAGSREIIQVKGEAVSIENVKLHGISEVADSRERIKHFMFDHCYDCMGGDNTTATASQAIVFQDLGTDVLQAAFDGFNACVFAYGQTGTGKTYTMMGQEDDIGLIPRICEGLFSHVADCADDNVTCRIDISYYEIYNERVRDLLQPELLKQNEKYSLKVREHPKEGPYVKDLSWHRVKDNNEIQELLNMGNENRVTAETYMHEHSSRSHAIVTIYFTQARLEENRPSEIVSKVHLVDLAGSERADPSSKPGFRKRLTEGSNINRSLVTLGYVIKTLAEKSLLSWSTEDMGSIQNFQSSGGGETMATNSPSGPNKQRLPYIPYRDSVLTWLLKDSLGGNSKTIMIATVTPASQYYSETISTLRYAQRAKNIINKPRINEDDNVALIRELRREIERLHSMLAEAQSSGNLLTVPGSEDSKLAERLHENEEMAKQLTQSWMYKWSSTHDVMKESDLSIRGLHNRTSSMGVMIDSQLPYLVAMDDDILSTGICIFHLKEGETLIGREDADREQDIVLPVGPHIEKEHCFIQNLDCAVTLVPNLGAMCAVQDIEITEPTKLSQGDYIVLGGSQVFRFNNPTEAAKLREHRRSQGSLSNLSVSRLSFGGLSRASSYSSIMSEDHGYLSPHSQFLKSSYPKRRHSDHIVYADADLCMDLERRYKSETERIEEAKKELQTLQEQHEKSEELRQEKEEEMYQLHDQHRQEIEDQRRHLAQLIEENQRARAKAEEELDLARESLAKEKEAFQKQLSEERERLRELKLQESLAVQTEPLQTSSTATNPDLDVFSQGTQGDVPLTKYSGARKLSVDEQIQELEELEFERRLSYRETEQSLSIQQEDLEDQYNCTQNQIVAKMEKIKQIEEQYKELDKAHLKEVSEQKEKLDRLRKKETELEVYIEEKEDLLKVKTDIPRPLRNAASEMFLLNPELEDIKYPQKTTSLSDIQAGVNEAPSSDDITPLSASTESLKSPISPIAMETDSKPKETSRGRNEQVKRKHGPEDKHSNISSVARNVTSRLYQPPEPKFKYVPKSKDKEIKSPPVRPRAPKERDLDAIGRGSPPRIVRHQNTRHSPSPLRDVNRSGSNSPSRFVRNSDKRQSPSPLRQSPSPLRHSPSPLRDTGRKASPSPTKGRGKSKEGSPVDKSSKPLQKTEPKSETNAKKKDDKHGAPKSDKKESHIMAVRNKTPSDNNAALIDIKMRTSPDRLNVAPNRHGVSSPMRQMASASSLASVPESLHEEDAGPLGASVSTEQLIKKRNKRGRASLVDDDEFRRHSAPDYDKLESEFNAYSKEMGFGPGEKEIISGSPTYRTSVSVDESELPNSQAMDENDTALTDSVPKNATSETQTTHIPEEREISKFYVSSGDEMTLEETENIKEPTECSINEIEVEMITDQSEINVNDILNVDDFGEAGTNVDENNMQPDAHDTGTKRDHTDGPKHETVSIPPMKKSKLHESDHMHVSAEEVYQKEHDESFSNDSLDEDEHSKSMQENKDPIQTDRLTQSLPHNLLLLREDHEKSVSDDSLEATEDNAMDLDNESEISKHKENAKKDLDIVINQNGDMLQVEVVDNSILPEGQDSEVDLSNSQEMDFEYEEPETFVVTLDIKSDENTSVPSPEDANDFDNVVDNVHHSEGSEHQVSKHEDKHLEKLKEVNVVSSNLASDMVHEELEVHLALEGEIKLTHEEIEVELKLEGESCVLGSEKKPDSSSEMKENILEPEQKALDIKTQSFKNVDDAIKDVKMNESATELDTYDNERVEEIMEISEADKLESAEERLEITSDKLECSVGKLESTADNLESTTDKLENAVVDVNNDDGISATEVFEKCRTIAVWTSQEFLADLDADLEGAGGLCSDDSLLDPSRELRVLQEALEQLPAKSSSKEGPQLSTARRAARQRAMIRKEQRTADSDGVSAQSDGSPTSGNLSKSSSRPGSGSRRRRRPNGRGLAHTVSEHTTDEYGSSDSDSLYSDDSVRDGSEKSGESGHLVNGTSGNRRLENLRPSDLEISEASSTEMPPKHLRSESGRRHIKLDRHTNGVEINSFDGGRSVGIQANRSDRFHSSSSTKTDTSDEFDISFASGDYPSIIQNMVVSPLSLWSNNDRKDSDSSDQNSSASAGVKVRLSDADRSITPTPRSSARSSLSVFSFKSNIDKGPTEVWSSSASDLRKLPGFNEELGYVIETEGMWPGQASGDYAEDAQSQRSSIGGTTVDGERGRLTPRPMSSTPRIAPTTPRSRSATPNGAKTAAKVVHVQFPDGGQSVNSEAFSLNVPVKYQVTIHEDNTNILYNVDKTEYKTYALRNQSDNQPSVIPDTIHVDLKESVTSKKHEKFESKTKEDIKLQKPDNNEDSGDDSFILERSFRSSCSSERELSVDNGAIPQETYKELTEKNEKQTCEVPLMEKDSKDKKKKKKVELQQSGIIGNTDYPGDEKGATGGDKDSLEDESDTTSDYGTFTSVDGRKGLVTFTSDSEDGDMASPCISPRASHVSGREKEPQLNQLPEQNKIVETSEETISPLQVEGQQLCPVQDVLHQPVVAARMQASSPVELVQSVPSNVNENEPPKNEECNLTNSPPRPDEQQKQKLPSISPRPAKNLGSSVSSNDDMYLSLEKLETSTSSSDYLTPHQSPQSVSRLVTNVEIPDIDSDKSSLSPTPRQSVLTTDEHNVPEKIEPIQDKAMSVRTVSVNTEAVSLVSHSPAITQQTLLDENDPAFTENVRKQLEQKIATLTRKERSLSDSAISSDFTDGDSSPRGSRFYDSGKIFGESYLRHIGPHGRFHGVHNATQSPSHGSGEVSFDAPSVKRSLFADSGNVYDQEDDEKDTETADKKEKLLDKLDNTSSKATGTDAISSIGLSKDVEKRSIMSEKALKLQVIPSGDAVERFPERLSDAVLAIKPFSYPRSVSLDGLSTLVNVDTHLSRAVRNIPSAELQQLDQNQNFMQDNAASGEILIRPESRVDIKAEPKSRIKEKSTSLSNLDPVKSKGVLRSLSEANIDDFEENDASSSSSDSITFVFVDKNNKRMEHVIMDDDDDICMQDSEGYNQDGDYSGSESQSPDSKLYSGSESQSPDFKCYSESESQSPDSKLYSGSESQSPDIRIYVGRESETPESRPYSVTESQSPDSRPISGLAKSGTESEDGFPGGFQSEEVTGRSISRHSDNIVDIVSESSSDSDSEDNEEIIKINGDANQIGNSREIHVKMENVSPPTYTDPSDEQTQSDGLDQNVANSGSIDDKPLRHRFGIDESVLPIPERAMSADNLPKHKLKFKDMQRSRSADMVEVGGMAIQESEEGIFPPAIVQGDDDPTDPSMSLRTMSEGGLDPVSQRTVSEIGMTYSSRTSSELDSVTSDSEEEYQEEITIEYAKTNQSMLEPGMVKVMPVTDDSRGSPSTASEGEVDASVLQNDEHIREVLRTVEKFIMPKHVLVDHATSTDDASCARFVSVGVQTTAVDSETQTTESTPIHVNPDQIILPALAAPFRAQSMESFGLGADQTRLVLSEGSDNWYTLGQLMVETTNLLRRINERLPDLENKRTPLPSTEESQAILKKWQEISVQTGYSLADLTTVGLQTEGSLLRRSAESTQIDKQFKMEPLEKSEVVTSDMLPVSTKRRASEISVQTEPTLSEVPPLANVQQKDQPKAGKSDENVVPMKISEKHTVITKTSYSNEDEPAKISTHTTVKPAIVSANSNELEALRNEHAKLIENLRNASASRTDRQEKIKARKIVPEHSTKDKESQNETLKDAAKSASHQEIVKVNIKMSPRSGVTVKNSTHVAEDEIVKKEKKGTKGMLHEQTWQIAEDGNLIAVTDEKPDFTSDRSRTVSDTSFSSEGTIESEIVKAMAGSENADPVEYAAARAGALNPLFKNDNEIIDDVLGEDIIKPEKREDIESQPIFEKMVKRMVIKPELFYGDSAEMYAEPEKMPNVHRNKTTEKVKESVQPTFPHEEETIVPKFHKRDQTLPSQFPNRLPSSSSEMQTGVTAVPLVRSTALSPVRRSAPKFGQSDDSTQVSMEFSDDFTQTDPDTSAETVIQVHTGKDKKGRRSEESQIVPSKVNTGSKTPVKARAEDSNSMTRELERLQSERGEIMDLLSLHYLPTSLTVELLEAKLNYCIGQTDLLLGTLDENFKPADRSRGTVVDQQFAKEYITKYRSDLKKSKLDILRCRERLNMGRVGSGRGRTLHRNQDLYHARRLAQIEAFRLERMREQQDYERSRCSTPIKGNTPLRGNTPLKGNSPIATPRSNISRDSSPDYSPAYMTPKEHKDHYKDLRKQLIRNVLDEERHHTRSCSPTLLGHHPDNRQLDASFGFSPKVSVSVSDGLDKSDVQAYTVAPGTHTDSHRTSSMDRYPHLSANYYQNPQPVHPQHKLDTKMTAESIFSPQESEQILREIREIQRRTQMSPREESLRTSSFSSTHSSGSGVPLRHRVSPRGHSNISGPQHRNQSPATRHSEFLNLNLESLHDSHLSDLEDSRPYSPYSAYAREHILPNDRPHDNGVLRGSYELYDSMPRERSHDRSHDYRSHDRSDGSHDPQHGVRSGLDGQRLSRLRPVSSADVKARIGRHKR